LQPSSPKHRVVELS